ncbi:MFS-type transporter [Apiospora arundinis]
MFHDKKASQVSEHPSSEDNNNTKTRTVSPGAVARDDDGITTSLPSSEDAAATPNVDGSGGGSKMARTASTATIQYPGSHMSAFKRRVLMFSLCLALFLAALDITIVATALPTITHELGANAAEYSWIGSSYLLASTASGPIWVKLSDVFGRKSALLTANLLFMAGSIVAALARTVGMLIAGRAVQGLGGGGLTVLVSVVIGDLFELKDRAKYYGMTGMVWAVAAALGPVLGGVFTQKLSWRWCFWINLPFEGVSLAVLFVVLKVDWPNVGFLEGLKSLDWIGSIMIVGGTIIFLYGLETGSGGQAPWASAQVICLIVFGILLLITFFLYEARLAKNPMIPMRIFNSVTNVASFATFCMHSFIFISYDYFLPLYFQAVLHFQPIISGVSLFALVVPLCSLTIGTGYYVKRTGDYLIPIRAGAIIMAVGTGLFINFGATTDWAKIIVFLFVAGLGAGPMFQTPMLALQSHLDPHDIAASVSAMTFIRNLCTSISIVMGSVLLQRTLGGEGLSAGVGQGAGGGGKEVGPSRDTYMSALHIMWIFYTAWCGVLVILTWLIKGRNIKADSGKSKSSEASDTEKGEHKSQPPTS